MPTTCAVVGCYNRQSKQIRQSFYRFPKNDEDRCCLWLAFVSRKNRDGSPWQPEEGDRICSDHFISGKKSDSATSPDFVPSIKPKKLKVVGCDEQGKASHRRFERARRRARMQKHRRKELEANKQRAELEQARLKEIRRATAHNHSYTTKEGTMISVPLQHPATREESVTCELAPLEEHSDWYQQLVSNEHEDENEERLNDTCDVLLEGSKDATTLGIPAEVGKACML